MDAIAYSHGGTLDSAVGMLGNDIAHALTNTMKITNRRC